MRTWLGTRTAALLGAALCPATTWCVATAGADGATTVVMDWTLRRCDFSLVSTPPIVARPGLGTATALVRTAGSKAIAEVHLADPPDPGTHFDVGLIQVPRPAAVPGIRAPRSPAWTPTRAATARSPCRTRSSREPPASG